jgi:hypothetical protein
MPQPTRNLEVAIEKCIVIDGFGINVSQNDANNGQAVTAFAAIVNSSGREEGLGAPEGIPQHKVLKSRI